MPDFSWRAARADAQIVEGHLQAASTAQAMSQLRAQGLTPLFISEGAAGGGALGGGSNARSNRGDLGWQRPFQIGCHHAG